MIYQIFGIIFPVVAIVLVGFFYATKFQPNMDTANTFNSNLLSVLRSPILIATLAGIGINLVDLKLWLPVTQMIDLLGQAAIPLLLFTLGTRLIGVNFNDWKLGVLGAILCPLSGLAIVLILVQFFDFETLHYQQLILFSVLPPAVFNQVMVEKYQQQPETVASIVMIGNIGSLFVLPIALYYVLLIN